MISKEFLGFLNEYKVVGLAIGVIIGVKVNELVNAIVNNLFMPLIGLILPSNDWRDMALHVGQARFGFGEVLSAIVDFGVVAFLVFLIAKYLLGMEKVSKL